MGPLRPPYGIVSCPQRPQVRERDSLAEDILQVSWIEILQSIKHTCFDGPKACPWMHRIVANTARDFHRKQVRRREGELEDHLAPTRDPEVLAQEVVVNSGQELRITLRMLW